MLTFSISLQHHGRGAHATCVGRFRGRFSDRREASDKSEVRSSRTELDELVKRVIDAAHKCGIRINAGKT